MKRLLTLSLLFISISIFSQASNKYIFKTTKSISSERLKTKLGLNRDVVVKCIFKELNLYSLEVEESSNFKIDRLKRNNIIDFISKDEKLTYRLNPNDEYFNQQYGPKQIGATELWEYNKGGNTGTGDEIVIAVLDKGMDIHHKDLFQNIWKNKAEIPNDGIDNDGNDYIDDYYGVDLKTNNDTHFIHNHGTSVAGIIGARGNNSIGMTGINWNVKILPITSVNSVSDVIEAYNYVYKERYKYNESNGANGSLIVSTNLSAGIPNAKPSDKAEYTNWCEIYDLLGSVGILNITSVDNSQVNVEETGDMPTLCTSDYLITVTSTDENDKFDKSRGYGIVSVDLAAPGRNIFSLITNDKYKDSFTGNSAAAPHVAGAIGLLYTIPCSGFTDRILANPQELGDTIKDYLLKYTDKHNDLSSKTLSGGRLNVYNTYLKLSNLCNDIQTGKFELQNISPNPAHDFFKIEYSTDNFDYHIATLSNSIGQKVFEKKFKPNIFGKKVLIIDNIPKVKGLYYLTLTSKDKSITKSVLIY